MLESEIIDWVKQEFMPVSLATPDETILQILRNTKRYWNTHSAFPVAQMYAGASDTSIRLTPNYKNVVKVYPATTPDWVLGNYPMWSLLGIAIIDNLTSDLIMLTEAYKNYRYYMGADFNWNYQKSDLPGIGGRLYMTNIPQGTQNMCVIGTKRLLQGEVTLDITGTSGTFQFVPIPTLSLSLTNGVLTYLDDGLGNLIGSQSGYTGTIDYTTGEWTVTGWVGSQGEVGTATYLYDEEITSEYIVDWFLYYVKAQVKMVEGNTLRKADALKISNDGQQLLNEGKEEVKELQERLGIEGRWMSFARRF